MGRQAGEKNLTMCGRKMSVSRFCFYSRRLHLEKGENQHSLIHSVGIQRISWIQQANISPPFRYSLQLQKAYTRSLYPAHYPVTPCRKSSHWSLARISFHSLKAPLKSVCVSINNNPARGSGTSERWACFSPHNIIVLGPTTPGYGVFLAFA